MVENAPSVGVAALYQFTRFDDPDAVRRDLHALCAGRDLKVRC